MQSTWTRISLLLAINVTRALYKERAAKRAPSALERCVMRRRTGSRALDGSKVENMAASEV